MSEPHVDYPSTGVTLEGDELDPEEDPYEPEPEEKQTESSSIYPIKAMNKRKTINTLL